jgi:hypothetical protein
MNHFIALACTRTRPSKTPLAVAMRSVERFSQTHWDTVYDGNTLLVLASHTRSACFAPYELAERGIVLGTLFSKASERIPHEYFASDEQQADSIARTAGQHLVDAFWGRYIAFICVGPRTASIVRDPTGGLPCFFHESDDAVFFFRTSMIS